MNKDYSFEVIKKEMCFVGKITYEDYSFGIENDIKCKENIFGLYIGYTKLVFPINTKIAIWFGGFNSYQLWNRKNLEFPQSIKGELYIENEIDNIDVKYVEDWPTYYDKEKNIVCIGDYNINNNDIAVEFCENIIAVLEEKYLKAIWIKNIEFIDDIKI